MKNGIKKWFVLVVASTTAMIVGGVVLSVPETRAEIQTSTDNVGVYIPVSCSMVYDTSASTAHTRNTVSGKLEENIGTSMLRVACNDKGGYVVYAIGDTNGEGTTYMSTPLGDDYKIPTADNIVTTGGDSNWGMKLSAVPGEYAPTMVSTYSGDNYAGVPNTWTRVAYKDSSTSKNALSSFTTTYAVYTSVTQPAGSYMGKVKYVMLHPTSTSDPTTTIDAAYAAAGKKKVILKTDGTTVEEGSEGSEDIPPEDIKGKYYKMQDMTGWICGAGTYVDGQNTTQLIDIRDNNVYYVTKLQDGNCWMTQNLALNLETTPASVAPLTSDNTDLNDNSLSGAYTAAAGYNYDAVNNRITWTPANPTKTFNNNSVSGWTHSNTAPSSARKLDGTMSGQTSTGNLYNWTAAIASNNSGNYTGSTYGNVDNNPQNSICPKGWRLPTISSVADRDEFRKLNNIYNGSSTSSDANLIISPLWFVRSGYVYGGTLLNYGTRGYYWSSTVGSSDDAYSLGFSSSSVSPAYNSGRNVGFSVRCVAR